MIELLIAELQRLQADYRPGEAVQQHLRKVTFVPVVGPFLTGKSTVMTTATRLDSSVGRVRSFTTRNRRPDEAADLYEFLPHTDVTLRRIWHDVEEKQLVQFTVHPTTGNIYGSWPHAWHRPYMLLDTLPAALESLQTLPFHALHKVAITTNATEWTARINSRTENMDERLKRIDEGIANLEWCLAQSGSDIAWLDNSDCTPETTAAKLLAIAKNEAKGDPHGRRVAEELLQAIRKLAN